MNATLLEIKPEQNTKKEFIEDPGSVTIGSTQYASCFGAE
jgi:hypothetical protein